MYVTHWRNGSFVKMAHTVDYEYSTLLFVVKNCENRNSNVYFVFSTDLD